MTHHHHGGHVVAELLEQRGVAHIYGQDSPEWLFSALSADRYTIMRDERSAGFAADAHARLSGRPVVAAGIHGPGFMNLLPALLEAREAGSPVIALVSGIETTSKGRGVFQELDQLDVADGIVKHSERVERADRIREVLDRAITIATSGRPGPVLVELPNDVLESRHDQSPTAPDRTSPPPEKARVDFAPWTAAPELVERLRAADRPVLLLGSGARGVDHVIVTRAAELLGSAVCVTAMGRGAFPETHPAFGGVAGFMTDREDGSGAVANELLRLADLLIVVGSALDGVTTDGGRLPSAECEIVRVDRVHEVLAADTRSTWKVLAESEAFLKGVVAGIGAVSATPRRSPWADAELRTRWDRVREHQRVQAARRDDVVTPSRLMRELGEALAPEDIVVADAAYSSVWALSYLTQNRHFYDTVAGRGAGTLGFGFPAAIGAARAHPDRRIIALVGDGGFGFGWSELETAARSGLNITCVVLNNAQFAYQVLWHELNGPPARGLDFAPVRHDLLAAAVGGRGQQVTHPNELEAALAEALRPGLSLLDVVVSADELPPFRKERHVGK